MAKPKKAKKKKKASPKRPTKKSKKAAPKKKKKSPKKRAAPKKTKKKKSFQPKPLPPPQLEGTLIGRVEDFFAQVNVIALTLKAPVQVGNTIHIKGHTTDLTEPVTSIQIDHAPVQSAKK